MFVCRGVGFPAKTEETKVLVTERGLYIGEKLRKLRHRQAHTQKSLAAVAAVNEITISELENNKRTASARTLRKLARALGVEVHELATEEPSFPGGAVSEEHRDAVLEHEEDERRRRDEGAD